MTKPISLDEFRERRLAEEAMASFDGLLNQFEAQLNGASQITEPLLESLGKVCGSQAHRRRDEQKQWQSAISTRVGWTTRDGVRTWTTRDGFAFTQDQIDAVVALIRDPERLVAMGLAPKFIEAATAAGWKPPEQLTRLEKDRGNEPDANT